MAKSFMPKQPNLRTQKLLGEWLVKADSDIRLAEYLLAENASFWTPLLSIANKPSENTSRLFWFGSKRIFLKLTTWKNFWN
jgi:hypothetical protein